MRSYSSTHTRSSRSGQQCWDLLERKKGNGLARGSEPH